MDFDIVIVGGGLAGLALAAALRQSRLNVAVVEGRTPARAEGWDARIYAISPANARFLDQIGVWQHLDPERLCPVEAMDIRGDMDGRLGFSAYEVGADQLAWIVESSLVQCELWENVRRQANTTLFCPAQPDTLTFSDDQACMKLSDGRTLRSRLIVAADGADSWTRKAAGIEVEFKHYNHHGVVANFECARPHGNSAYQWFREDGVLAYLPLPGQRISMVWSTPEAHADELQSLPTAAFCTRVAEAGQHVLGDLRLMTPPAGFPLRLMRPPRTTMARFALIGDAAHAIHPLSGHGINLGFQDAMTLGELLARKPEHLDCGDPQFLRRYERARKEEVIALQTVTDGLQRLFSTTAMPVALARNLGLNLTNALPVVKNLLVRYALAS